jgi:carbon starvation protein
MAHIFSSIPGMKHLMSYWYQFSIMFEALFILTTIDAFTRVGRYALQDVLGTYAYKPLKQFHWWPGILLTSTVISVSWGYLLYSGDVASIWPMFGIANQLLAVAAFAIGTSIVLKVAKKKIYALITFLPLCFLTATVFTAGFYSISTFYKRGDTLGNINGSITILLLILVGIIVLDSARSWLPLLKTSEPVGLNTEEAELETSNGVSIS